SRHRPSPARSERRRADATGSGRRADRHDEPRGGGRRGTNRAARAGAARGVPAMSREQAVWVVGRVTIGTPIKVFAPLRVYGRDRIPRNGPLVFCFNHFSWLDPWAFGSACPRTIYYVAKQEAHDNPFIGPFIRAFGTSAVRRGESDREAV